MEADKNRKRIYLFGGWCPNINGLYSLKEIKPKKWQEKTTWADVIEDKNNEEIDIEYHLNSEGLISAVKFGIPEYLVGKADIEWDEKGLFLLKLEFNYSWNFDGEEPKEIEDKYIRDVLAKRLYCEVKKWHHRHIHHSEEEDSLLGLFEFEEDTHSLVKESTRRLIARHIFNEYRQKHWFYTKHAQKLLADEFSKDQLEVAIHFLYQGIGEMTFGIAFLGMYGSTIFTEKELGEEHIKFESAMRSLEVLKGKYTFEFMKRIRTQSNIEKVMEKMEPIIREAIISGIVSTMAAR